MHGYGRDSKGNIVRVEEFIPIGAKIEVYRKEREETVEFMEGAKELMESIAPPPQEGEA